MAADPTTIEVDELCLYAVDVWLADAAILTDESGLLALLRSAAEAGGARVLGEMSHVFPNGAVTAALVLSQSHLTIHTWPEHKLANIDLLAYGLLNGEAIIGHLEAELAPVRHNVTRCLRAVR